mmetsp:Transcript_11263/g.43438  ORF Transcript_11263/g.43438 Transcript_11263/m.43438 type:complete len:222 (+) Transcript_11263:1068-1733(+)
MPCWGAPGRAASSPYRSMDSCQTWCVAMRDASVEAAVGRPLSRRDTLPLGAAAPLPGGAPSAAGVAGRRADASAATGLAAGSSSASGPPSSASASAPAPASSSASAPAPALWPAGGDCAASSSAPPLDVPRSSALLLATDAADTGVAGKPAWPPALSPPVLGLTTPVRSKPRASPLRCCSALPEPPDLALPECFDAPTPQPQTPAQQPWLAWASGSPPTSS